MQFFQKHIHYETLNEKFARARLEQSMSLDTAEKFTGVARKYLEAIEGGDYHILPGEVYAENFIKKYALFLGLDTDPILQEYRRERRITKNSSLKKQEKNCYRALCGVERRDFISTPTIMRLVLGSMSLLIFFIYLGFRVHSSLRPPDLVVFQPQKDIMIEDVTLDVLGKTEPEAEVWINNRPIFIDPTGYFKEKVELTLGLNALVISAQKKHSEKSILSRKVLVVSPEEKNKKENLLSQEKISNGLN